jgi:diguanylate cyclase (GGDEF)-like protein/PAS domain S-box-containing protein
MATPMTDSAPPLHADKHDPARRLPLATRLGRWFAALFVLGIVSVVTFWYTGVPLVGIKGAKQQRLDTESLLLSNSAHERIDSLSWQLRERRGDLVNLAENHTLAKALKQRDANIREAFARIADRTERAYPDFYEALLVADIDAGRVLASSRPELTDRQAALEEFLQRAIQPGLGELVEQIDLPGGPRLALARQMMYTGSDGRDTPEAVGVMLTLINLRTLLRINEGTRFEYATLLIDARGEALSLRDHGTQPFVPSPDVARGFEGVLQQTLPNGDPGLVAYRYFQVNQAQGWTLVQYTSLQPVLAQLRRLLAASTLLGMLVAAFGVGAILAVTHRLTRPLAQLRAVAAAFGSGDQQRRFDLGVSGSRELAELGASFNAMADALVSNQQRLEATVAERTAALATARDQLSATLEALPDLLFEVDIDGRVHDYHSNQHDLLLLPPEEFLGRTVFEFLPAEAARLCHDAIQRANIDGWSGGTVYSLQLPQGLIWFEASVAPMRTSAGEPRRFIFVARDITARQRAEEEVRRLAFFDPLTGLANRRLMLDRLDQARLASARSGQHCGLLLVDLDRFKNLNDSHGHDMGDQLLIEVARRFLAGVREGDTVARLGGDEFVVVLRDFPTDLAAAALAIESIAEKLRVDVGKPYALATDQGAAITHQVTLSIGVCLFCGTEFDRETLLTRADTAMYQAKQAGRDAVRFFDPSMQAAVSARLALEEELREAVAREQFELHLQPLVSADGQCIGAEALVRWRHPQRGVVGPGEFIEAMERSSLILPLGHWVLRTACGILRRWQDMPQFRRMMLALNISARQIQMESFVAETLAVIEAAGIDAGRLKLELTESLLLDNTEDIITKMQALMAVGVRFALDDFGTGYSSLAYLKRLPLYQLKIDRSFVRDLLTDPNDVEIARLVLGLGKSLGLSVLAEGVESTAQRNLLVEMGCDAFQGYLFSRPIPLDTFESWVRDNATQAGL